MTVYFNKQRARWLYNFQQAGKRFSGYCLDEKGDPVKSRSAAKMAEAAKRQQVKKVLMAPPPGRGQTVAEIVVELIPRWKLQTDWQNKQRYLRDVLEYFGPETPIASIEEAKAQDLPMYLLQKPIRIWVGGSSRRRDDPDADGFWRPSHKPRSPATVNLILPVARMIFERAAAKRDGVTGRPLIERMPKIDDLPVNRRKARPVPDDVAIDVMSIVPRHTSEAITATFYFGFRRDEIFGAKIAQVDFSLGGFWLDAADSKDREDAFMPGAPEAMAFLAQLVEQARSRGTDYLITWRRKHKDPLRQAAEPWVPIKSPRRAWKTAMRAIREKYGRTYRWHDLRASFITHVALTSGGLAAQRLARHKDFETTQAYIEIADEVRRRAANDAAIRPALSETRKRESQTASSDGHVEPIKSLK